MCVRLILSAVRAVTRNFDINSATENTCVLIIPMNLILPVQSKDVEGVTRSDEIYEHTLQKNTHLAQRKGKGQIYCSESLAFVER